MSLSVAARGERVVHQIPVKIPTSASKGSLRILVSDGETLDHASRANPAFGRKLDLASTIALLNKEHTNNRLYVSLLEADPEARVADNHHHVVCRSCGAVADVALLGLTTDLLCEHAEPVLEPRALPARVGA